MEYAKVQKQLQTTGGPNESIFKHFRKQGLSIYKGLPPMLIGAPLQCAVRFSTLDSCTRMLSENGDGKGVGRVTNLFAGLMAGVAEATLVVTPMETLKTRLVDMDKGLFRGVKDIVSTEGLAGLYKGLAATIMKSASNQALRFIIFNEYKTIMLKDRPATELTPMEALAGGMTAGCLGALGNTPFDVIKTRMQGLNAAQYSSTANCFASVIRTEGVTALYRGLVARLCRVVPGQGLIFMSYSEISRVITTALSDNAQ
jgi:solute carrier family 25 citrate transporter 1